MLKARRDGRGGGACKAIPSIGEVEGRLIVLEFLALASLTRLLEERDRAGKEELIEAMRRTISRKCRDAKICESDACCAADYGVELIEAAMEQARDAPRAFRHA